MVFVEIRCTNHGPLRRRCNVLWTISYHPSLALHTFPFAYFQSQQQTPKMAPRTVNINDLASMFEDISLHDVRNSHILEIEFPVSELLSNSHQVPHLDPPASLETREAPPHDQRRAGVYQSVCRLCHKITEHGTNPHRENYNWTARRKLA